MIQRTAATWQTPVWQKALAEAYTRPEELFQYLELDEKQLPAAVESARQFPLRVPHSYAELMEKGNAHDPLLLQVLPQEEELIAHPGYTPDPVGDLTHQDLPGLLHKYQGRALIISSESCGVNCRFCFRRHFPYSHTSLNGLNQQPILDYLKRSDDIHEIILSGGDPLVLSDRKLQQFSLKLGQIKHLKRLRIHTRLPVVIPQRITSSLIEWLSNSLLKPILVLHINHPRELSPELKTALRSLHQEGIALFSQTVLLKGVNDHPDTLAELFENLFTEGVQPYYLHLLDRVQGAAHFDLPHATASTIYHTLRSLLPGYMIPKMVQEISGEDAKTLLI